MVPKRWLSIQKFGRHPNPLDENQDANSPGQSTLRKLLNVLLQRTRLFLLERDMPKSKRTLLRNRAMVFLTG